MNHQRLHRANSCIREKQNEVEYYEHMHYFISEYRFQIQKGEIVDWQGKYR
jgi:hypothetical protein